MKTGSAKHSQTRVHPASASRTWLRFWGVRGSIPSPGPGTVRYGGNTSCLELRTGNQILILDAGTGVRALGQALLAEFEGQAMDLALLLTHTHWDHIQGLPFFLPLYHGRNRLRILGYEGARQGLVTVLTGQMENPFFPVSLRQLPANLRIEELTKAAFRVGAVRVRACPASHPGKCFGYRLFTPDGSVAFFPDNELRPARPQGAGEPDLAKFLRGTDVLVMDAQYDRKEYQDHVGWGHGCLDEVVKLALAAQVKQLFLFHHDPDHDDAKIDRMVAQARSLVATRKGKLRVEAAREGLTVGV